MKISKTTLFGLLALAFTALQTVSFDATGHLAMTPKAWFGLAIGFGLAVVGYLQKDAGEQEAELPDGEKKVLPSHETPDDPAAKPVVKQ